MKKLFDWISLKFLQWRLKPAYHSLPKVLYHQTWIKEGDVLKTSEGLVIKMVYLSKDFNSSSNREFLFILLKNTKVIPKT